MAWVRIDDQTPRNEKMLKAGPAACWLWLCGIAHCQSQLTDGHISDDVLPMIGVTGALRCRKLAEQLVRVGLFERGDEGYVVHDYLARNDTREEALEKKADAKEQRRQAGLASGERRRMDRRNGNEPRTGSFNESATAPLNETRTAPLNEPSRGVVNPIPSHPIPEERERERDARAQGLEDEGLSLRAGRLVERYGVLFCELRHGAKYHPKPNLDWQDACGLCRTWADDRHLEQLARIVLMTDDAFISRTDRSFHIFAIKASWADDRLRAVEREAG